MDNLVDFFEHCDTWSAEIVFRDMKQFGYSVKTVKRAKKKMGIRSYQARTPSGRRMWFWSIREPDEWRELVDRLNQAHAQKTQATAAAPAANLPEADAPQTDGLLTP